MSVGQAFCLLPWYGIEDGFFSFDWISDGYPYDEDYAPAMFLLLQGKKLWLIVVAPFIVIPILAMFRPKTDPLYGKILIICGALGFGLLLAQGFLIGLKGWQFGWVEQMFGPLQDLGLGGKRQLGMGYGAMFLASAFLFIFSLGIAARGAVNGDVFVVSSIGFVVAIVSIFVFFPIINMLLSAFIGEDKAYSTSVFVEKITDRRLWSLGCVTSNAKCGAAWNSAIVGSIGRGFNYCSRSVICPRSDADKFQVQNLASGDERVANNHAAFRHWSGDHTIVWPVGKCNAILLPEFLIFNQRVGFMACLVF